MLATVCAALLLVGAISQTNTADQGAATPPPASSPAPAQTQPVAASAPAVAAEFRLKDLFRKPVGPRGMEYSDAARALDGRAVRVQGFMARIDSPQWRRFLLTTYPTTLADREFGPADDLPPDTLVVELPPAYRTLVTYRPGAISLTGTLRLTQREFAGRTFHALLELSSVAAPSSQPQPKHP